MGLLDVIGALLELLVIVPGSPDWKQQPLIVRIVSIAFFLLILGFLVAVVLNAFGLL
jgi:hypothetical protein